MQCTFNFLKPFLKLKRSNDSINTGNAGKCVSFWRKSDDEDWYLCTRSLCFCLGINFPSLTLCYQVWFLIQWLQLSQSLTVKSSSGCWGVQMSIPPTAASWAPPSLWAQSNKPKMKVWTSFQLCNHIDWERRSKGVFFDM